jgi:rhodanese-related sulfurtransferase
MPFWGWKFWRYAGAISRLATIGGLVRERTSNGVRDLTAEEVARGLANETMMIVDVREPREVVFERIPGAFYLPMSAFDPEQIPDVQGRIVVFLCASGIRSVTASQIAQGFGLPYDAHLAGGLKAWKAAGLPTEQ